jgi:hypothetical protein
MNNQKIAQTQKNTHIKKTTNIKMVRRHENMHKKIGGGKKKA